MAEDVPHVGDQNRNIDTPCTNITISAHENGDSPSNGLEGLVKIRVCPHHIHMISVHIKKQEMKRDKNKSEREEEGDEEVDQNDGEGTVENGPPGDGAVAERQEREEYENEDEEYEDEDDSTEEDEEKEQPNDGEVRHCWVCFASDEDDAAAAWVQPCRCRGTAKWVHQTCIQRWVDEKQKGHADIHVACPQCGTDYIIMHPNVGPLVMILDTIDGVIFRVCPYITAGIMVGSVYWTAVTYGAVTLMQVVGHKDGLTMMEQADPFVLLVGLPTIPIILVMGKMLRWEDQTLRFLRRHAGKVPILRDILSSYPDDERVTVTEDAPPMSTPLSTARVLCGALLLPTIANICGKLFFESINSSFQRTLLGGVAFITLKGAFKIYYKQQKYVRICQRRIMDYTSTNRKLYQNNKRSDTNQST